MTRYLMRISYLGTRFRSSPKVVVLAEREKDDPWSVQGALEMGLKRFKPLEYPRVCLASRTDQGVHALGSAIHVDLQRPNRYDYDPHYLAAGLNRYFDKNNFAIRVQHCQIVPSTFHARHSAKRRTYLYRMAIRKPEIPNVSEWSTHYTQEIPFVEWKRCHFIQNAEFDVEKFRKAAALFPGTRDFRTFMGSHVPPDIITQRVMHNLDITPGQPLMSVKYSPAVSYYNYWDITCSAQSFLYRQVRRTVGALLALAQGRLTHADIEHMLNVPSKNSWNERAVPSPAFGLYLMNIEYDPSDLILPQPQPQPSNNIPS